MKKTNLIIMLSLMIMLAFQSIAYAGTGWECDAKEIENVQNFSDGNTVRVVGTPRGALLSSFEVALSDKGSGRVGIFGAVLCHESMKEIRMNLYLDVWNTSTSDWEQIKSYKFSWNETNTSLSDRNAGVVDFDVTGLQRGRDYRVRGYAGAYDYNGNHETWNADSQSIQVQSLDNLVTE